MIKLIKSWERGKVIQLVNSLNSSMNQFSAYQVCRTASQTRSSGWPNVQVNDRYIIQVTEREYLHFLYPTVPVLARGAESAWEKPDAHNSSAVLRGRHCKLRKSRHNTFLWIPHTYHVSHMPILCHSRLTGPFASQLLLHLVKGRMREKQMLFGSLCKASANKPFRLPCVPRSLYSCRVNRGTSPAALQPTISAITVTAP